MPIYGNNIKLLLRKIFQFLAVPFIFSESKIKNDTMNSFFLKNIGLPKAFLIGVFILCNIYTFAQDTSNSHIYKPNQAVVDTADKDIEIVQDTNSVQVYINQDSIDARVAFIKDSIVIREAFVQDSIIKRELFVQDSILKHERKLDSLNFLRSELPKYIEASLRTASEDIIINTKTVNIVGDSTLSDFEYRMLVFNLSKPFTPWKSTINLSDKPVKYKADIDKKTIQYLQSNAINHRYTYNKKLNVLRIDERSIVLSKRYGKLFNLPIDSVFFDTQGRIVKIKKYHHYHKVSGNYQKGASMYVHLTQVKQYVYTTGNKIAKYEVTKFCDRWRAFDPEKVCNIETYTLSGDGNNYIVNRKHNPANTFSDGRFVFEYDNDHILKSVEFKNNKGNEDWKTMVEVNEAGNVSRYVYINKDKVSHTLLVNYYLDDPKAKHKVETITCNFEDDRISYYQKNNTTGKSRTRERLTMEWSDWR